MAFVEGWPQVEVQLHIISRRLFSGLDTCTSTTHQKKHQDLKTRTLEYRQHPIAIFVRP